MAQLDIVKHQLSMVNEKEKKLKAKYFKNIRRKTSLTKKSYQRNESSRDQEGVWETDVPTFSTDVL